MQVPGWYFLVGFLVGFLFCFWEGVGVGKELTV